MEGLLLSNMPLLRAPGARRPLARRRICAPARPRDGRAASGAVASAAPPRADGAAHVGAALRVAGVAAAAAALAFAASDPAFADAAAAIPDAITDENLMSDFNVRFLGVKVDHRVIVEWVVAGQTVGFLGSLIGGWYAADRKKEVERLNVRLVAVNKQLREQARVAQAGAYAPDAAVAAGNGVASNGNGNGAGVGTAVLAAKKAPVADDSSPAAQEIIATLRTGKSMLKMRDGKAARGHFERALVLTRDPASGLETPWKAERKALRGLGASMQLMGQHEAALGYMQQVLDISEKQGDMTGVADAMGVIADIYTDAGQLDKAGLWYDKYINAMQA